ncbi:uncharacterized protein LOC130801057 [Amaranthus tricolor]|uniref:uncharacterized protein LOC130801057 n=1 Tax=Amaranthus tricolor TaxID=29722 RepID=UPI002588D8BC|nr:uncharacterized protein LOC130801057 [Amaranthus tricolor]
MQVASQPTVVYCSPGSMSSFLNLRRTQKNATSQPATDGNENEGNENASVNEVHGNAVNEVHGNEANEVLEVEPQGKNTTAENSTPKKTGRGPTLLTHVHKRTMNERPLIILNCYGQPIGPTKKHMSEYSLFLGTLARNSEYLPLNYCDWPSVPQNAKDEVWDYVQRKYLVSSEGKDWALETIGCQWKGWKCRSKALYYYPYATYEERWKNRPNTIPESQFKQLLHYWDDEGTQVSVEE